MCSAGVSSPSRGALSLGRCNNAWMFRKRNSLKRRLKESSSRPSPGPQASSSAAPRRRASWSILEALAVSPIVLVALWHPCFQACYGKPASFVRAAQPDVDYHWCEQARLRGHGRRLAKTDPALGAQPVTGLALALAWWQSRHRILSGRSWLCRLLTLRWRRRGLVLGPRSKVEGP